MPISSIDLDMLAYDFAEALDHGDYDLDVSSEDIRPHLEEFLTKVQATAAANEALSCDAATWSAAPELDTQPVPQSTRRPRATYLDWFRSQLVLLGATAVDAWHWQCPYTGCKVWAGPYPDPIWAKKFGFKHVHTVHKEQYFRTGRRGRSAR